MNRLPLNLVINLSSKIRSSHPELFCQKGAEKFRKNPQKNTCARKTPLLTGLQLFWKRDSGKSVFLWILGTFLEKLFYRTPLMADPGKKIKLKYFYSTKTYIKTYGNLTLYSVQVISSSSGSAHTITPL